MTESAAPPSLKRVLGPWLLTAYGVGVTIGAGIYVLIGAVAAAASLYAPLSFLVAGFVALFTALSYAELSVRFPFAAGEAVYAEEAFRRKALAPVIGLLVLCAGIVAAGTITLGASGYLHALTGLPGPVGAAIILVSLTVLAAIGIEQSALVAGLITVLEVGGLLLVCALALAADPGAHVNSTPPLEASVIAKGVIAGAALSFFAFIGFEDMVNVAEELKAPEKTLPRAILLTLAISGALYLLVSFVAVRAIAPAELAASSAPLVLVAERSGALGGRIIGAIAVIAALNGVLVQIIKGARVIYGLARRGHVPAQLGAVHALTRTPIRATVLFSLVVGALAVSFPLAHLAATATQILLTIFLVMNVALIAIKRRGGKARPAFEVPLAVPVTGALTALALLLASFIIR